VRTELEGTGNEEGGADSTALPIADAGTVGSWIEGLRQQWGAEPADMADRIEVLERFCAFVEREPDIIIAECCREVEGGKRIRIKKRRFYSEKIDEFQASVDGDARAQARAGNIVRSFMIHNGIFMQGGVGG
jgi:hypothetical protein